MVRRAFFHGSCGQTYSIMRRNEDRKIQSTVISKLYNRIISKKVIRNKMTNTEKRKRERRIPLRIVDLQAAICIGVNG